MSEPGRNSPLFYEKSGCEAEDVLTSGTNLTVPIRCDDEIYLRLLHTCMTPYEGWLASRRSC
jgi:hypothetical protein